MPEIEDCFFLDDNPKPGRRLKEIKQSKESEKQTWIARFEAWTVDQSIMQVKWTPDEKQKVYPTIRLARAMGFMVVPRGTYTKAAVFVPPGEKQKELLKKQPNLKFF